MYISKFEFNKKYNKKIFKKIFMWKTQLNNKKYIKKALKENQDLLNNINGYSLDQTQRKIVVSEEDSTLVVAGAGSGKSLTILGRIMYLVKQGISPKDILVISFTNEASNSLKNKLAQNGINMEILTFHKLGRRILKNNGQSVDLVDNKILDNIIEKNINNINIETLFPHIKFQGDDDQILKKELIKHSEHIITLKKILSTFLNLFKANGYTEEKFKEFLNQNKNDKEHVKERNQELLKISQRIYQEYQTYLLKHKNIDFHDMISKSIDTIEKYGIYPYKYIIIDEYQDTSLVKCKLIQTIKKHTNASLLAVGDDFQSIYSFTGSNLKIFTEFENYFPSSKIFKLENTYRNSLELINTTSKFILKNKNQIYKKLKSNNHHQSPIHIYYYNKSPMPIINKLKKELQNPLILGRNNNDIKNIKGNTMTVHKSKGLEADNVIIVNLEDKIMGFPNKLVDDDILKYVKETQENYPYEEERRLFYVALTRTKNTNYLLVNQSNPSIFVTELLKENKNIKEEKPTCKVCKSPLTIRQGKHGLFYGCIKYPKCKYIQKIN